MITEQIVRAMNSTFPAVSRMPVLDFADPPPVRLLNPQGRASLILVCDHASNVIPAGLHDLGLQAAALSQHIAWDIGAAEVVRRLAQWLDAPAVLSGYSRLLIDCNRVPGHPESIPAYSDGVFIPGNRDLSDAEADWRLETFFWPYHHAITTAIAHLWRHGRVPAVVSIHSFTPQLNGGPPRPWQVGILWNRDLRLALPVLQWLRARPELCVGDNEPYSGRDVGYTLETHAGAAGLPHVEFEIRQDLLADAAGCDYWAQLIAAVLREALADQSVHQVVYY